MKPQKSKSKQGGLSTGRIRKDDLRSARQHVGRQVGENDPVVAIAWREG